MEPEVVQARAVVRGRVQMVGFRAYVLHHAADRGLRGTVRNERDGTLEVMLEGPRDAVENLIRLLHRGPSAAHVDRVDVEYQPASGGLPPMRVTA
jgi:acylphosphatase